MSLCKYFQLVVFFSSNHWWRYKLYQNIWLFEKYTLFLRLYPLCYTKVQSYCWKYSIFLGISDSNLIDLESHGAHIGTFNQWHSLVNKSLKRRKSKVSNTSRHSYLPHPFIWLLLLVALFSIAPLIIKTDPSIEPNPGPCRRRNQLGFLAMTLLEYQVIVNTLSIINS